MILIGSSLGGYIASLYAAGIRKSTNLSCWRLRFAFLSSGHPNLHRSSLPLGEKREKSTSTIMEKDEACRLAIS